MAHFAELDENNTVVRVLVTDTNDPNGDEGYQWLIDTHGGRWIKTSYNSYAGVHYLPDDQRDENGYNIPSGKPHLRYNYAGIGYTYDEQRDAFIPPMPTQTHSALGKPLIWEIDENTCQWVKRVIES
jgi:hypothetical protein